MLSPEQYTRLLNQLPRLRNADAKLLEELRTQAFFARIPAGHEIFTEADRVEAIALLLSGRVRVYKIGESGREITLYRFGTGESCVLSANAIISQQAFNAIALVEEDAEAVMIASATLRDWLRQYDFWREYVFSLLSQRLSTMLEIVDDVAFRRMDMRLAALLSKRGTNQTLLNITHQEIAAELGSSREVISRILESFAKQHWIRLGRSSIEILEKEALEEFALR